MEQTESVDDYAHAYAKYHDDLVRVVHLMVGSRAVAEELVHDAFERLNKNWESVDRPAAWLRTVATNLARSHARRIRLARLLPVPLERTVGDHEIDEIWWRVRRLPTRQRIAVVLRYYEDLPIDEIAAVMCVSPTAVSSMLHRALNTLRKELQ